MLIPTNIQARLYALDDLISPVLELGMCYWSIWTRPAAPENNKRPARLACPQIIRNNYRTLIQTWILLLRMYFYMHELRNPNRMLTSLFRNRAIHKFDPFRSISKKCVSDHNHAGLKIVLEGRVQTRI